MLIETLRTGKMTTSIGAAVHTPQPIVENNGGVVEILILMLKVANSKNM